MDIIATNLSLVERFYFVLHYFEVAIIFKLAFHGDNEDTFQKIQRRKLGINFVMLLFLTVVGVNIYLG